MSTAFDNATKAYLERRVARLDAISASLDRIEEHLGLGPIDDVEAQQEVPAARVAA